MDDHNIPAEGTAAMPAESGTEADLPLEVDAAVEPNIVDAPPALDLKRERQNLSRLGFGVAALVLVTTAVSSLTYLAVSRLAPGFAESLVFLNLLTPFSIYLFALPVLLLIIGRMPIAEKKRDKLSFGGWVLMVLIAFGLMYIGNFIGIAFNGILSALFGTSTQNPVSDMMSTEVLLVNFIGVVVIAPIGEELVFRKLLMDRLSRYGGFVSILVSGLAFGLMHGNFSQFFYATLLGFLMGYIYYRTGNVWLTVAIHATVNFVGGILSLLLSNGLTEMLEKYGESIDTTDLEALFAMLSEYGWIYLATMVLYSFMIAAIVIAIVIPLVLRRDIKLEPGEVTLPRGKRFVTVALNAGFIMAATLFLLSMVSSLI